MGTQPERIEFQVQRVRIRVVVAREPSAFDIVPAAVRSVMAKPILHNYPASIHVICQVITKRHVIRKREVAIRHNDLVLLKLSQSGRADRSIEQVTSYDTGL